MNILIIEDNKFLNNQIAKFLKDNNFNIFQAFSIKEAIKILKNKKIDVILLDLILNDENGTEIFNFLDKDTKVIVISAYENKKLKDILYKKGIVEFISKSLNKDIFFDEILITLENIQNSKKRKVCLIGDLKEIKNILVNHNFKVNSNKCDIFIIDLSLKDVLKKIKEIKKEYPYNPIIGVYKELNSNEFKIFRKNGVIDFIQTPVFTEELLLKVNKWNEYIDQLKKLNKSIKKLQAELKKEIEKNEFLKSQARKAQLGDMLAIIAHQLKQPINHISMANYLIKEYLKENIKDKEIAIDATKQIDISTQYMATTIDIFKNFFKPTKKRELTTLKQALEEAILILKPLIDTNNIKIKIDVKEEKEIRIFKNDLVQVLINLIKNAIEALIENKVDNPTITIEIDKNKIKIKDNAGGIPKKVLEKLFKPYVSTKGEKGTGLGLYMSKMIVEDVLKGEIKAYNEDNGAVFEITL